MNSEAEATRGIAVVLRPGMYCNREKNKHRMATRGIAVVLRPGMYCNREKTNIEWPTRGKAVVLRPEMYCSREKANIQIRQNRHITAVIDMMLLVVNRLTDLFGERRIP